VRRRRMALLSSSPQPAASACAADAMRVERAASRGASRRAKDRRTSLRCWRVSDGVLKSAGEHRSPFVSITRELGCARAEHVERAIGGTPMRRRGESFPSTARFRRARDSRRAQCALPSRRPTWIGCGKCVENFSSPRWSARSPPMRAMHRRAQSDWSDRWHRHKRTPQRGAKLRAAGRLWIAVVVRAARRPPQLPRMDGPTQRPTTLSQREHDATARPAIPGRLHARPPRFLQRGLFGFTSNPTGDVAAARHSAGAAPIQAKTDEADGRANGGAGGIGVWATLTSRSVHANRRRSRCCQTTNLCG